MPLQQLETNLLIDEVRQIIEGEGLSFEELAKSASDVVLFGSRALGVHRRDSDLDLLIISDRSGHIKRGRLDLVFVPRTKFDSPLWRRTELARHIEAFGVSLMHSDFHFKAIVDQYAALRKQARLHKLIKTLLPCWHQLNDSLRLKYFTRVGRELQRYSYLKAGAAVPPTANLDAMMNSLAGIESVLVDIQEAADMSEADALRMYRIMMNEAQRIRRRVRRFDDDRTRKAA